MKKVFLIILFFLIAICIGIFLAFSVINKKNVTFKESKDNENQQTKIIIKKNKEENVLGNENSKENNIKKLKDLEIEESRKKEEDAKIIEESRKKEEDAKIEEAAKIEEIINKKEKKIVKKVKTEGKWYLVNYNNEYHELPDDASELIFSDVCEENKGVTTYCDRDDDLKKFTAKDLGEDVCDGGGKCDIGDSCLLWHDETQDNGDVEMKTATYKCE